MNTSNLAQLDLPAGFLEWNGDEREWLAALPGLIARLADAWSLTLGPHYPNIRINYVAPATRADGTGCVFKVSRHLDDNRSEIAALQLWDGNGCARLLEADPASGALLIERLEPGNMLVEVSETDD